MAPLSRLAFAASAAISLLPSCSGDGVQGTGQSTTRAKPAYPKSASAVQWFAEADSDIPPGESNGISLADFDSDGAVDIAIAERERGAVVYAATGSPAGAWRARFRVDGNARVMGVAAADVVGDAAADLVLATADGVRLLKGLGDLSFDDVTELWFAPLEGGDNDAAQPNRGRTIGVQLADVDADGLLDIYALAQAPVGQGYSEADGVNRLWLNEGDRFREVADSVGLADRGATWVSAIFDLDDDGDLDVMVGNDAFVLDPGELLPPIELEPEPPLPPDAVYVNDGPGADGYPRFHRVDTSPFSGRRSTMGLLVSDHDGDGRPDVYQSDYGHKKLFLGPELNRDRSASSLDIAAAWRDDEPCAAHDSALNCLLVSWGSAHADFDRDGIRDLFVLNGSTFPGIAAEQPLALFRGSDTGLHPVQPGLEWTSGRGLCAHDLDGDADLDIALTNRQPGRAPLRVLRNETSGPFRTLSIQTAGTTSNPAGVGTLLTLRQPGREPDRHWVGASGTAHSSCPSVAQFAIDPENPAQLTLRWPSGITQILKVPADTTALTVTEPSLLELASRVQSLDEGVDVVLHSVALSSDPTGNNPALELTCSGCVWDVTPALDSTGALRGRLRVHPDQPSTLLLARVNGIALDVRPRVWRR